MIDRKPEFKRRTPEATEEGKKERRSKITYLQAGISENKTWKAHKVRNIKLLNKLFFKLFLDAI